MIGERLNARFAVTGLTAFRLGAPVHRTCGSLAGDSRRSSRHEHLIEGLKCEPQPVVGPAFHSDVLPREGNRRELEQLEVRRGNTRGKAIAGLHDIAAIGDIQILGGMETRYQHRKVLE